MLVVQTSSVFSLNVFICVCEDEKTSKKPILNRVKCDYFIRQTLILVRSFLLDTIVLFVHKLKFNFPMRVDLDFSLRFFEAFSMKDTFPVAGYIVAKGQDLFVTE